MSDETKPNKLPITEDNVGNMRDVAADFASNSPHSPLGQA